MRKSSPILGGLLIAAAAATATVLAQSASQSGKIAPDPGLVEDLVAANHILYQQGVVDGFGHISARHDKDPARFLLARSMAPGLVAADDIMEFDLDGNALDQPGRQLYVERFIHSEIYKAYPKSRRWCTATRHRSFPLARRGCRCDRSIT